MAISPQTREKNAEMKQKHGLSFPILSDPGNAWARKLSLVFSLPEDLRAIYLQFGLSLPEHNGDDTWELPMPGRLVVDSNGTIRSIDSDPDYRRRPEPEATLEAVRALES